ncbi:MAG TPA: transketolase [Stellaceae bacterium]|jgi:transketolase
MDSLSIAPPDAATELRALRRRIIEISAASGEGHIPSAFSILDILWVLYDGILRIDPREPQNEDRDRFILSKGHGCLGLYAILASKGFFPFAALADFAKFNSPFGGHPDSTKLPGVEASTGSLGHGFPMAVGSALGMRIRELRRRVFCLIGDGEANEGSIWEAALLAAHHRLANLVCIVDYNHSTDRALALGDIGSKFAAFGWVVCDVDGHDHAALRRGLALGGADAPLCLVAHTVKGFGCPPMENQPAWHHRSPTQAEMYELVRSLA